MSSFELAEKERDQKKSGENASVSKSTRKKLNPQRRKPRIMNLGMKLKMTRI